MRLATGADEILPLRDARVRANPAYLIFILLARVIVRLGSLETITPKTIEEMFVADLNFLQDLYNRINGVGESAVGLGNGAHSEVGEESALGKSYATPPDELRREVAYIALHFHWPYDAILNMEHGERREWVDEILSLVTGQEAAPFWQP